MEIQPAQAPSGSGSGSSSAAYPRWVTLECRSKIKVASSCATAAAARTRNGTPIQVSLSLAEPPATSVVRVTRFPDGVDNDYCNVIAAHSDSLLIAVYLEQEYHLHLLLHRYHTLDYFIYNAGDAAADPPRPPSLVLLPQYSLSEESQGNRGWVRAGLRSAASLNRELNTLCTGILHPHRGDDDEVVVAELKMVPVTVSNDKDKDTDQKITVAELFLFRSGAWSMKRPPISCCNGGQLFLSEWTTNSVLPIGDRTLCWVHYATKNGGILVCDLLEESPCLQYVPLPSVPTPRYGRYVCATATAGGSMLKCVNICPRCCCGGVGVSDCQRSHHAYTIHTWTLRMDDDGGIEWVMDGMVDATELWSLDTYKGLPRVRPGYPVVISMYEPHVICFSLCESHHVKYGGGDKTLWLLMVDMRSKTIQSVTRHPEQFCKRVITSNISYYLNPPYPTCSSGDGTSMDNEKKKRRDDHDDGTNWMQRPPCMSTRPTTEPAAAQATEILAAFQEIPSYGLSRDDMLKAYGILSSGNGCRVKSLLKLPMKLRKDWLLMEIKADDIDA